MKLGGFLFLLSGWAIVIAAVLLLANAARAVFILAGLAVEIVGLAFVLRSHSVLQGERG
jgi:uncharacterized membrane protein